MKILGLSFGRRLGNTEVFIKEALMGAEEYGAEVEFIRVLDLEIKPCIGCHVCTQHLHFGKGEPGCSIKDDFAWLDDKVLEADGVIIGTPIYDKAPNGLEKVLNDRMSSSHDLLFNLNAKKRRQELGITEGKGPDERFFKPRTAGLIAVGGSDWTTMGLPMLQLLIMPMQMTLVDQHTFGWTAHPKGVAAIMEEKLERARNIGRHVTEALTKPIEEAQYYGDPGTCPVCHTRVIEIEPGKPKARCAICGVQGTLKMESNQIIMEVSAAEREHSHWLLSGKQEHQNDLNKLFAKAREVDESGVLPAKLEKYRSYLTYSKPPKQ